MSAKHSRKGKTPTMADTADIHELYEESVQNVANEVVFIQATFRDLRGRTAYFFREDFCGTASAACEWVRQGREFRSIGVDIDPSVLDWGRKNRVGRLAPEEQARVQLIESDVQTVETPKVDVMAAFNFSYWIFEERAQMVSYMRRCHHALKEDVLTWLKVLEAGAPGHDLWAYRPLEHDEHQGEYDGEYRWKAEQKGHYRYQHE